MTKYLSIAVFLFTTLLVAGQSDPTVTEPEGDCEINQIIEKGLKGPGLLKGEKLRTTILGTDVHQATVTLDGTTGEFYTGSALDSYLYFVMEEESNDYLGSLLVDFEVADLTDCLDDSYMEEVLDEGDAYHVRIRQEGDDNIFSRKHPYIEVQNEKLGDNYKVVVRVYFPDKS